MQIAHEDFQNLVKTFDFWQNPVLSYSPRYRDLSGFVCLRNSLFLSSFLILCVIILLLLFIFSQEILLRLETSS